MVDITAETFEQILLRIPKLPPPNLSSLFLSRDIILSNPVIPFSHVSPKFHEQLRTRHLFQAMDIIFSFEQFGAFLIVSVGTQTAFLSEACILLFRETDCVLHILFKQI